MTATNTTTEERFAFLAAGIWGKIKKHEAVSLILHFDSTAMHVRQMKAIMFRIAAAIEEKSIGQPWTLIIDGLDVLDRQRMRGEMRFEDAGVEVVREILIWKIAEVLDDLYLQPMVRTASGEGTSGQHARF